MELIPAIALTATVVALFVGTGTGLAVSFFLQRKRKAVAEQLTRMQIDNASTMERLAARQLKVDELESENRRLHSLLADEQAALSDARHDNTRLQTSMKEQRQQAEEKLKLLNEARESLQDGFKNLANEIFESKQKEFKTQSKEQLSGVLDPLHERIKAFEKRVEDTYNSEAKERFSLQKEVRNLQELNARIAQDAVNLTNALKGESKKQGIWGEMVLERVLESSGLGKGREYDVQVSLKSAEGARLQPDAIVRLPEGKDVVIDSKVSLSAYEKYCSTQDEAESRTALDDHIRSIRTHIKQLSEKDYQALEGIRTLDYVLMFVPIESAFSLATQEDPALYTDALSQQIAIVTPSTLLATLRTIQNMWRIEQQNRNADEIADRAGKLYDKFVNFVADLELIGQRLDSTRGAWDDAWNKLVDGRGNLVKRAEDMKKLGAKVSKSLPQNLVEMPSPDIRRSSQSSDS